VPIKRSRPFQGSICIKVQKEPLQKFIVSLIEQWRFTLVDEPEKADLLLAQEGFQAPSNIPVLWLTRSRYQQSNYLSLPVTIEELWSTIETYFHKPPRNHIRINQEHPVNLTVRGEKFPLKLTSFSDLGARLTIPRDLSPGEEVSLELSLNAQDFDLKGKVIYAVPQGDFSGTEQCQIGILFNGPPGLNRNELRSHILYTYLKDVQARMIPWEFQLALGYFNVPREVLKRLGCL